MLPLRDTATISASMDPCIFPSLGGASDGSSRQETWMQTLLLPETVQQSEALPKGVNLDSVSHLAFALLLKAYCLTGDVAYGLIHDLGPEGSEGVRSAATAMTTVGIRLDDTATVLENLEKLFKVTRANTNSRLATRDRFDSNKPGNTRFNTAFCLTRQECPLEPILGSVAMTLFLQVDANDRAPRAIVHFRSDHFDSRGAQNVVSTFESILATVATGLHYPLGKVELISASDRHQIMAWNAPVPFPASSTLNECFEKVFQRQPDKEAVYTSDGSFTYGQLDDLSTLLASHLIGVGVRPNVVVPICMNKSRWVTCAMIAVWKAGGAFTAMEPAHPDARLFSIVEELGAKIVVCDRANAPRFEGLGVQILPDVEDLASTLQARTATTDLSNAWRMSGVTSDDLAFVVFTSGSTGRPKGILNSHGRITTEHQWYRENMGFSKDARILQFASYAFNAGTADQFRTLLNGATLCVPSEVERTSDLVGFIKRSGTSRILLTPSLLRTMNPQDLPGVRDVFVSGEPGSRDIEEPWSKGRRFVQIYGSTEGGTWIKETKDSFSHYRGLRPASGDQWLVDPDDVDKLVPIGGTGELVLESHEMAIGYLNDSAKTAHAFLKPPAWADKQNVAAGCRYLRLGDLGRYESDGSITVYGRADTQIKINGQRVDLQDIESNLRVLLLAGSEAVVDLVTPIDTPDRPLLTAFVRLAHMSNECEYPSAGARAMLAGLQHDMSKTLPLYMVPKVFIMTKELPRNFSQKIDRRKLRLSAENMGYKALAEHMPTSGKPVDQDDGALADRKEQIIAQSWATVLRMELNTIKRGDSFLALGGDSLAAIRLVPVIRSKGLSLTTLDILSHHVLKDMAKLASDTDEGTVTDFEDDTTLSGNATVALQATDVQEWAALVGAQNGGWIDHILYDFSGSLDVDRLQDSCQRLVAAHSILRSTFTLQEERVFMQISAKTGILFEIHHASTSEIETKSQEICAKDRVRPLGAPIVRFDLITASTTRHRLIVRLSHAQYDAFVARDLGEHLRLLYRSQPLPRTLPFHEYVKKIQEPDLVQHAEDFWKNILQGSQMPRLIKRQRVGPPFKHVLDGELQRSVEVPSLRHCGINPAALVKTAWILVISSLSQSKDVVFGDFVSGRQIQIPGIETVFGPCVNFTPVRALLEPDLTNLELLKRVQEQLVQAIPYESLGMRHIIERCTNWGPHARYSSIVNFINVQPSSNFMGWSTDDSEERLEVTRGYEEQQHDKTDLWLLCLRRDRELGSASAMNSFDLFFRYSKTLYQSSALERIADMYCDAVFTLATALDGRISIPHVSAEMRTYLVPVDSS